VPASGAGSSVGEKWSVEVIKKASPLLSKHTAPRKGGKPTIFFSFGGLSEGGGAWNSIFGSKAKAAQFGKNAAKLVTMMANATDNIAYIGIDLDVEGASSLPEFESFIAAFRAVAPFNKHPVMMCALSGLAFGDNDDHYKVDLLKKHGPTQKGVNYVNFMVDNVAASCDVMSGFWRNETLKFLPYASRIFGIWGINNMVWIIQDPGCTTGPSPLFKWMKTNGVGFGIWQWWLGDPSPVNAILDQVRSASGPAPGPAPAPSPGPGPAPGPATTYKCENQQCIAESDGVSKSLCEANCVSTDTYKCINSQCVVQKMGGLTKKICDQLCG
jgi:hypothetical protein